MRLMHIKNMIVQMPVVRKIIKQKIEMKKDEIDKLITSG